MDNAGVCGSLGYVPTLTTVVNALSVTNTFAAGTSTSVTATGTNLTVIDTNATVQQQAP